jgi:putative CocE/NonD family hydrolase
MQAPYRRITNRSLFVPMRDGARLALDVLLPADLPAGTRLPTIISLSRYWRAFEFRPPFSWWQRQHILGRFLASHGYARVIVDVRGTGASFGYQLHPFWSEERSDSLDLMNWIVAQPWSNGKVGAFGDSYTGTAAELLALTGHPALKAIIPRFNEFDTYTDLAFPGGILHDWFIKTWNSYNHILDANRLPKSVGLLARLSVRGVKPVDTDSGHRLLREAVKEHQANGDIYATVQSITYRDDSIDGLSIDEISVHHYQEAIERSGVAIYGWGSWLDAGTANAVIKRFVTMSNPQQAIIGPWNHAAVSHASPYQPPKTPLDPGLQEQFVDMLRFFDAYLKDMPPETNAERRLTYYTLGEEIWKTTKSWPPAGSRLHRWYFAGNHSLLPTAPTEESSADAYVIDFQATTGQQNRWHTQVGGPVHYPDRAAADHRLLNYTSPPLAQDAEITGHPVVTLSVTSTAADGAFFVYLEDVDEQGVVRYVTEGQLRALHRAIAPGPLSHRLLVPYHSFSRNDGLLLVPGENTRLTFDLLPTSVLIRKGHCIRVAIAGHDNETFARIPADSTPVISVARNAHHPSFIDLPVIERGV